MPPTPSTAALPRGQTPSVPRTVPGPGSPHFHPKHTAMRTPLLSTGLLLVATASAQNLPLYGFMYNWDRLGIGNGITVYTRGTPMQEEVLTRIDSDDYKDWALDANGMVSVQGMMLFVLDANDGTQETFNLVAYPEDPLMADFPDLTAQAVNVPIVFPPTPPGMTPGQRAYRFNPQGITTPVVLPNGVDLFFGTSLPTMISGMQPFDGLFVGSLNDDTTTMAPFPFDVPGPAGQVGARIGQDSYVCFVINGAPMYPGTAPGNIMQLGIDIEVASGGVGGVALATTPQVRYPESNAPFGTSSLLSGMHPDIQRGDDIGFGVVSHTSQVPSGSLTVVMLALGPSPIGSIPIGQLAPAANSPNSHGNVCIDFTAKADFLTFLMPGTAPNVLPGQLQGQVISTLSASARQIVAGLPAPLDLWWQAFVLDLSAGGPPFEVRTSGCAVQKLK